MVVTDGGSQTFWEINIKHHVLYSVKTIPVHSFQINIFPQTKAQTVDLFTVRNEKFPEKCITT